MDDVETRRGSMKRVLATAFVCAAVFAACGSRSQPSTADSPVVTPPNGSSLQAVTIPDLSKMEPSAQKQMRGEVAALRSKIADSRAAGPDLGAAYGEMGKLFMASTNFDAAELCFLNAQTLAPTDLRWPYYLGQLYKVNGPLEKSVGAFERSLQLQPSDIATLVWLGDAYLAQGRAEAAAPLFAKALAIDPQSAAAHAGSGRAALAARDYA